MLSSGKKPHLYLRRQQNDSLIFWEWNYWKSMVSLKRVKKSVQMTVDNKVFLKAHIKS